MDSFRSFDLNGRFSTLPSGGSLQVTFGHRYEQLLNLLSEDGNSQGAVKRQFSVTPDGKLTASFVEMAAGFLTPVGSITGSGACPYFAVQFPDSPGVAYILGTEEVPNNYKVIRLSDRTVLEHSVAKWKLSDITWEKIDHGWRVHVQFMQPQS